MSARFVLRPGNARDVMAAAWRAACDVLQLGKAAVVVVDELQPTRTKVQNEKMWAVLGDLAKQVEWPIDGTRQLISKEDWKEIITAGVRKCQRVSAGIEGGYVMLGARTSRMTVGEMADVIECALCFGNERGVQWSNESKRVAEEGDQAIADYAMEHDE